jgi:hypothetical protein
MKAFLRERWDLRLVQSREVSIQSDLFAGGDSD